MLEGVARMLDFGQDPFRELAEALLGQVLPGSEGRSYPLRQRLGEGGQGWVFRATWNGSVDVVVKVLRPETTSSDALARFQREAEVLRSLSQQALPNPHVVRFYDHAYAHVQLASTGQAWDLPFTVLELVEGETLEQALGAAKPRGLALDRARRILRHVVLALEAVHARNVVHRDLKPSNILLARAGGREIAKVTDFGLAKLLDPGLHRTSHLAGATMGYAPPEQFENGNPRVGRATDVFSLAAIFYEMVTGLPAFPIQPNSHPLLVIMRQLNEAPPAFARVRDRLPPELGYHVEAIAAADAVLARALSPEPHDRYATATELFEAIERALSTLGSTPSIPARPPGSAVFIRPSSPPGSIDPALARTEYAEARPAPPPAKDVSKAETVAWQRLTGGLVPGAFRSIAVSAAGDRAAALGSRGPALWTQGHWASFQLPVGVEAATMRAAAWHGERLFLAGAGPGVVWIDPVGSAAVWPTDSPGVSFHGAFADGAGIVLAGERVTPAGRIGVIADLPFAPRGGQRRTLVEVPGASPLCGVIRLGGVVLACGDEGSLAVVDWTGAPPRAVHACAPPLVALAVASDGSAVAVGGGGFVFSVWPTLQFQLEAVQTTRDLFAVARAPEGAMWCAGDAGRILRRSAQRWVRVGAEGVDRRVLTLHVARSRVLAFCDDGSVFEGTTK